MANTQGDGSRENGSTRDVSFESSLILSCAVMVTGRGQDKDLCNRIRIFVIGQGASQAVWTVFWLQARTISHHLLLALRSS